MKTSKKIIIFIVLNLAVTLFLNSILNEPSITAAKLNKTHEAGASYNTIVLGQSHAECGINPAVLDENLNADSMNCARALISIKEIYYILLDADSNHTVKRVIMELNPFYWNDEQTNGKGEDSNALYFLSWKTKPKFFFNEVLGTSFSRSLFDYTVKANSIINIPTVIKTKLNPEYLKSAVSGTSASYVFNNSRNEYSEKGFEFRCQKADTPYWEHQFETDQERTGCEKTFKKICDYCEENGIELICFISPVHPQRLRQENFDDSHEYFEKLCQKNNVRFIDFNYVTKEALPREDKDFVDIDGHTIVELSDRTTKLLCDFIKGDLKDCFYSSYDEVKANIK